MNLTTPRELLLVAANNDSALYLTKREVADLDGYVAALEIDNANLREANADWADSCALERDLKCRARDQIARLQKDRLRIIAERDRVQDSRDRWLKCAETALRERDEALARVAKLSETCQAQAQRKMSEFFDTYGKG